MERPPELLAPAWVKHIGDVEVLVEITARLVYAYDRDKIKMEDSRSLIWIAGDLHDLFLRVHASGDKDYWAEKCFTEHLDKLVDKFLTCMEKEPDWITKKHWSMYGKETGGDLLLRHPEIL